MHVSFTLTIRNNMNSILDLDSIFWCFFLSFCCVPGICNRSTENLFLSSLRFWEDSEDPVHKPFCLIQKKGALYKGTVVITYHIVQTCFMIKSASQRNQSFPLSIQRVNELWWTGHKKVLSVNTALKYCS